MKFTMLEQGIRTLLNMVPGEELDTTKEINIL